jgi:hypothetical protein
MTLLRWNVRHRKSQSRLCPGTSRYRDRCQPDRFLSRPCTVCVTRRPPKTSTIKSLNPLPGSLFTVTSPPIMPASLREQGKSRGLYALSTIPAANRKSFAPQHLPALLVTLDLVS